MSFERIAEDRIREAMKAGEFDDLPNRGKPVDLEPYFAMPEDVRMAHSILKNANCLPEEVALMNDIARLQGVVQGSCDPASRDRAVRELRDLELQLGLLRDQRRARR